VGVSYIAKASTVMAHQASQNLNDIRRAALAYTFLRNVCAHSCANFLPAALATTGQMQRGSRPPATQYLIM
jgi:hypothetical protein